MTREAADRLLARVWSELDRDPGELGSLAPLPEAALPARLDVSALAVASVAAASLAGWARIAEPSSIRLDGARIASAFQGERIARFDGVAPEVWSPLSGFRRAGDGWVRTHGNYPHHAAALRRVLGLTVDGPVAAEDVDAAVAARDARSLAGEVTAEGGMCVVVAREDPEADAAWRRTPLVEVERLDTSDRPVGGGRRSAGPARAPRTEPLARRRAVGASGAAPLVGIRVLDLTRVIAGPVATRTLALLGADVLRVDPPHPPEIEWQHLETGPGKRSTRLDVRVADDAARLDALLGSADVLVLGYRPAALDRLGLAPATLARSHPGLVVAQLSAWGFDEEAGERGGFDSLVQAASGISFVEGSPQAPGVLPAQALDHATGYLLAAAIVTLIERRERRGGAWLARMSLRRTAAELLGMPRRAAPGPAGLDDAVRDAIAEELSGPAGEQRLAAPAIASPDGPMRWRDAPRRWGSDRPEWAA
ncbi:CoA transferase [Agromyces sp. SYSU T0242]|uniref:CoA transferase n=1 Tax=Agromyces litoreus TaxID=3158561 RepID=UPI0033973247